MHPQITVCDTVKAMRQWTADHWQQAITENNNHKLGVVRESTSQLVTFSLPLSPSLSRQLCAEFAKFDTSRTTKRPEENRNQSEEKIGMEKEARTTRKRMKQSHCPIKSRSKRRHLWHICSLSLSLSLPHSRSRWFLEQTNSQINTVWQTHTHAD